MGITIGLYGLDHPHAAGFLADLDAAEGIERILVHDAEEAAAREAADGLRRGEFRPDWEATLADPLVPAVCILTDTRRAGPMTLEAIERGKWVYADKPGALDAAMMREIAAAGERTGARFCPCYARRAYPETQALRQIVGSGEIGGLLSFQATWITSQVGLRGPEHWLFHAETAGGGIVPWLACHWIDGLRVITGERVVEVSAMTATTRGDIDVEEIACVSLRLEGGAIGTLRAGYLLDPFPGYDDHDLMLSLEGTRGSVACLPRRKEPLRLRTVGDAPDTPGRVEWLGVPRAETRGGYAVEMLEDFVRALESGREPPATAQDALYVLEVCEAVYGSAREGRSVRVRQQPRPPAGSAARGPAEPEGRRPCAAPPPS